ncbi:hypothetical protein [Pseudalkalibacillus caeni]|uniref:Uncharacterized protein n=1 Tax=Exobacillus caeni TaxID=2574798 RepID=A0A5R9F5E6_9BACL|nr:hypothetical protein [Pseudalkalibacillus caeni]TLS36868.1 hypothetical protein FCL54_13000 [Pseudalkalibacillus caeni]
MFTIAKFAIIFFIIVALLGTMLVAGKSSQDYMKKSKQTSITISVIYFIAGLIGVAVIVLYFYFF